MSDDEETPLQEIVGGVTIGLILAVAFGLLAIGYPWFWVVFIIGFAGILPAMLGLTKLYERRRAREREFTGNETADVDGSDDPLALLRHKYARGDLSDAEFERKLDRLLKTESPEDIRRFRRGVSGADDERESSDRNLDLETE